MTKTLLATAGAFLLAASALSAAPGHSFSGARGSFGGATTQVRPSANYSRAFNNPAYRGYRGANYRGGYYRGGYGRGYYGHRYYYGGVPYFYDPFFFGFGYGYYGSGYYGYPYGDGAYGSGYYGGAYNGRIADNRSRDNENQDPSALPKEVQRQLSKRGYYRGSVDGEFGPASKSALTRFQRDNNLRATGRVDGATLKALGFEDREREDSDD